MLICIFTDYTKWQGGIEDIGCSVSSGCSENDKLIVAPFLDSAGVINVDWNAKDKDFSLPYICQSKCPRYYIWVSGKRITNNCF